MRVAGYKRVSSRRLQADKWSLPAQHAAILDYCQRRDWPAPTWYTETHSAKSDDPDARPAFRQLLADARALRFDTLVVVNVNRFARSAIAGFEAAARFERAGVRVVTVEDGDVDLGDPEGEFTFGLRLILARRENRVLGRRTRAGMAQRAAKGLWLGGTVPWGAAIADERLVIDPARADTLALALTTIARQSLAAAAAELNRRGAPTARGNPWSPAGLKQWLAHADWLARMPAPWPDLLAQARARRPSPRVRFGGETYMLTGLLRCACGGTLQAGGYWTRRDGTPDQSLRCVRFGADRPTGAGCPYHHRHASRRHYEALVTAWLCALPDLVARVPVPAGDTGPDLAALRADLAERRALLGIALADRTMPLDAYRARLAALAREESALPPPPLAMEELGGGLRALLDHWHQLAGAAQNAALRELIDHCLVTGRDLAVVPVPILASYLGKWGSG